MRLLFVLFLVGVLFIAPVSVRAQEYTLEMECGVLSQHDPQNDAEYKPGVDVHGGAVAPADLNPEIKSLIYPFEIPIEISALKLMDLNVGADLAAALSSETGIAHVTVYEDGRVEYNGEDVSSRISYKCLDEVEVVEDQKSVSEVIKAHGQREPDDVISALGLDSAVEHDAEEGIESNIEEDTEDDVIEDMIKAETQEIGPVSDE